MFNSLRLHYGLKVFQSYKWSFTLVVMLMVTETAVSLTVPYLVGQQSQSFLQEVTILNNNHLKYLYLWVALFAAQAALRFLSTYNVNLVGARLMAELSCRLYDHIQVLPIQYFQENKRGDVLSMLTNDLAVVSFFASSVLTNLIPNILVLIGAGVLMYMLEPTIALLICFLVPIIYIILKLVSRGMQPISRALVQRQADSLAQASENIGAISLIKAFNKEASESSKFKRRSKEILALRAQQFRLQALLSPLIQFLASLCILIVVIMSVLKFNAGTLSIPDLISLLLYGIVFTRPLGSLAGLYGQLQQVIGASERLLHVYHLESEPRDEHGVPISVAQGDIVFDNVEFAFPQRGCILKGVSFHLKAGQNMLIYGQNGGGKTTMLHLLMRFFQPSKGAILIDGQNIQQATTASLRHAIGLVSQDVLLLNGSIYENLTYGVANPAADDVYKAASQAGLDNIIMRLPQGYETQVGEGGVRLSGGQRQRIALARALLMKPKILLLDEPTSMLDEQARLSFKEEFHGLFAQFTVIMISHDPTLSDVADVVYQLENGTLQRQSTRSDYQE
ncbi:ABC transporter ATP-binding protein [Aestuariibacter sp. GS-14]|uniref:ABC transporter ATP-binding protein n=1 Tax=Aestuariibacter sp. GS-14 TaxID=2590670 RepID=UPI0015E86023|nr:ABC transporter ATP-binding protein [Aestuariibacter sp. GS-14]